MSLLLRCIPNIGKTLPTDRTAENRKEKFSSIVSKVTYSARSLICELESDLLKCVGMASLSSSTTIRCIEPLEEPWNLAGTLELALVSSKHV